MKRNISNQWSRVWQAWLMLVCGLWMCVTVSEAREPAPLRIESTLNQVNVFWPAGLDLVQPQQNTNLVADGWQDFGAPTSATNLVVNTTAGARAFYRLRFLSPNIVTQPQDQSVALGADATFNVAATGTGPLSFQWRRNSEILAGQTTPTLLLTNVVATLAGDYSVVIANRAGAATSAVAVLKVASVSALPRGIYMGKFAGQTNTSGIAFMTLTNGQTIVLGDAAPQIGGTFATNLSLAADGSFSTTNAQGAVIRGSFAGDAFSGTLLTNNVLTGTFTGERKPDTGTHATSAGYYVGTFGGLLTGDVLMILAADGTVFTYLFSSLVGGGGSFGTITAANTLAGATTFTLPGTTTPGVLQVNGTLNPVTRQLMGTYSFSGIQLGTFSLSRSATP